MTRPDVLVAERYRLVRPIAGGGMGTVWEAYDERLRRRVAAKQLHPVRSGDPAEARLARDRAMREARITARLHHVHAVDVYDVVELDGEPCLIMQFLPSQSLQTILSQRTTLPVEQVARIGSQVASALSAAHAVGIVHRDVKPGNILIDENGDAKITDFGISHAAGDVSLTSTGLVTGTPAFLAPEVARGADSDPASDVFSLGATLYTALEGAPPFGTGDNPMATLHRVASGHMVAPTKSGPLTPILRRMLAMRPADRPTTAEIARTLSGLTPDETLEIPLDRTVVWSAPVPGPELQPRRRSRRPILIGVIAALLAGGVAAALAAALTGNTPDSRRGPAAAGPPATNSQPQTPTSSTAAPRSPSQASSTRTSAAGGPPTTAGGPPTASELASAIEDYYALLPGDTAAAWPRMTSQYKREHAGGRVSYDQFWGQIDSVSVSDVSASPPHSVTATLTYHFADGRVVTEKTAFGLVRSQGMLKIARSAVLSSNGG